MVRCRGAGTSRAGNPGCFSGRAAWSVQQASSSDPEHSRVWVVTTDGSIGCPFCGSANTELISLFGQQLLTVQYYCRACHTPFERVKDAGVMRDAQEYIRKSSE